MHMAWEEFCFSAPSSGTGFGRTAVAVGGDTARGEGACQAGVFNYSSFPFG